MDKQIINSLQGRFNALQGICVLLFFRLFCLSSFKEFLENSLQRHGHCLPFFIGIFFELLIYQAVNIVIDIMPHKDGWNNKHAVVGGIVL